MPYHVYCSGCGHDFSQAFEMLDQNGKGICDLTSMFGGRCPSCRKPLSLDPDKVTIKPLAPRPAEPAPRRRLRIVSCSECGARVRTFRAVDQSRVVLCRHCRSDARRGLARALAELGREGKL